MNKKLLSAAIAGALAASVAAPVAQADVTIYGRMHMSLDYFDADTADGQDGISDFQVASNSSRIGFKGSEDLGGSLKAIWQVETGLNTDEKSSGSTWATRNSFLGLSGGWGTVIAGKHDTPMKILGRKLDPFGDTIGDNRAITGQAAAGYKGHDSSGNPEFGTGANNFNLRTSNTLAYISPTFLGGVTFIGALVADPTDNSSANSNNDNGAYSASLTYSNGGLYAAAAYEYHYADASDAPEPSGYRVGASYKFQNLGLKIGGMFEDFDGDSSTTKFNRAVREGNDTIAEAQANGAGIDRKAWTAFVSWDFMGNNTIKAAYTGADDASYADDDSSAYMASVGLDHKFSKRTKLYLVGTYLSNEDDNSAYQLGAGHNSDTFTNARVDRAQKAISLGMIHNF